MEIDPISNRNRLIPENMLAGLGSARRGRSAHVTEITEHITRHPHRPHGHTAPRTRRHTHATHIINIMLTDPRPTPGRDATRLFSGGCCGCQAVQQ